MFFKSIAQSFLLPVSILTLSFFVLYASSKLENKLETRGIKLYAFFTISFLWVCAIFMLLGEMFETDKIGLQQKSIPGTPMPSPHGEMMPPSQTAPGVPNGDEEMTLNPDEGRAPASKPNSGQETRSGCPYLHYRDNARIPYYRPNNHLPIEV